MDRTTKLHLYGGLIAAVALAGLLAIAHYLHPALALAIAGPMFGWGIERYQAIRREGVADWRDIVSTALPFEAVAVLCWLML